MPLEHKVGTREEWLAARRDLLDREKEHTRRGDELTRARRDLPWVPIDKEYRFETDDGTKTLPELFDGSSQLLVYHLMFGPEYEAACPSCTAIADGFQAFGPHMRARDVTLTAISRAPLAKLQAYKQRMGWKFPWVSSYGSDFPFDFGFAFTEEQMAGIEEIQQMIKEPPDWLQEWAESVGTDLQSGLAEGPGWMAFALEDGVVYHAYSRLAPDRDFVVPYYHQLLDRTPKGRVDEFRALRHDEFESAAARGW